MSKYNVSCDKSLGELNTLLTNQMFIGGNQPNAEDAFTYEAFNNVAPCVVKYPYVASWFYLAHYFMHVKDSWKVEEKPVEKKENKNKGKKEEKKADDVDDMFADTKKDEDDMFGDVEESADAVKAKEERMRKAKEAKAAKTEKKKPAVIAKSILLLDVKVWEQEQDLAVLANKLISEIVMDGLVWKTEFKTPEIAFGMKKLVIGLVVEDEKVSVEDVIEKITAYEEEVQSVDIQSFNKI